MLLTILGWFWIVTGVIFLLKPEWLRTRLQKKSTKKLKKIFFVFAVGLGILLIKATWGIDNILAKVVMVCGLIAIAKGFFFLKAESSDKILEWFTSQDVNFFRYWSVAQIAFGAIILTV